MYLSKLILNPRNAGVRRDVARPYELHRTLMRCVDGAPTGSRLLFRVEPANGSRVAGPVVLVQSAEVEPDWTPLLKNGYVLNVQGPRPIQETLRKALEPGRRFSFRLVANPTKKVGGKRVPLIFDNHEDEKVTTYWNWLHRKADAAGFEVLVAQDAPFRTASNRRKKPRYAKSEIPLFGVRFDGVLEVVDPTRLLEALRQGIGSAKAFGFGLLSLAPAR